MRKAGELHRVRPSLSGWEQLPHQKEGQQEVKPNLLLGSVGRNSTWPQRGPAWRPPTCSKEKAGPSRPNPDPRTCRAQEAEAVRGAESPGPSSASPPSPCPFAQLPGSNARVPTSSPPGLQEQSTQCAGSSLLQVSRTRPPLLTRGACSRPGHASPYWLPFLLAQVAARACAAPALGLDCRGCQPGQGGGRAGCAESCRGAGWAGTWSEW